jgi:hypothetical protein
VARVKYSIRFETFRRGYTKQNPFVLSLSKHERRIGASEAKISITPVLGDIAAGRAFLYKARIYR